MIQQQQPVSDELVATIAGPTETTHPPPSPSLVTTTAAPLLSSRESSTATIKPKRPLSTTTTANPYGALIRAATPILPLEQSISETAEEIVTSPTTTTTTDSTAESDASATATPPAAAAVSVQPRLSLTSKISSSESEAAPSQRTVQSIATTIRKFFQASNGVGRKRASLEEKLKQLGGSQMDLSSDSVCSTNILGSSLLPAEEDPAPLRSSQSLIDPATGLPLTEDVLLSIASPSQSKKKIFASLRGLLGKKQSMESLESNGSASLDDASTRVAKSVVELNSSPESNCMDLALRVIVSGVSDISSIESHFGAKVKAKYERETKVRLKINRYGRRIGERLHSLLFYSNKGKFQVHVYHLKQFERLQVLAGCTQELKVRLSRVLSHTQWVGCFRGATRQDRCW